MKDKTRERNPLEQVHVSEFKFDVPLLMVQFGCKETKDLRVFTLREGRSIEVNL